MPKIYKAIITDINEGISNVSLVEYPAVEENFLAFAKEEKPLLFSADEEKHIITGLLMCCDTPIYRYDEMRGDFYIVYDAETIKIMAEKMLKDGCSSKVNIEHQPASNVEGVNLVELYIKDSKRGITPTEFEGVKDGSLFATYKVHNEKVWKAIKEGTFKGFSLEGYFSLEEETKSKLNNTMSRIEKVTALFKESIAKLLGLSAVKTDKGVLNYEGEELAEGIKVTTPNEEGEEIAVADGEYILEDGRIIVIVNSEISEIKEAPEQKPAEEQTEEEAPKEEEQMETKCEEEKPEEETEAPAEEEKPEEEKQSEASDIEARLAKAEENIEALFGMVEQLLKATEKTNEEFKALKEAPKAESVHATYKAETPSIDSRCEKIRKMFE